MPHTAYIGMGSNLGDRVATLAEAERRLKACQGVAALWRSALYETEPIGGPGEQGLYLNAAVRLETSLEPQALLARLLEIERDLGRERVERWGPRTLDLDLLLYADQAIKLPDLIVPHPRLHERAFVLLPLKEIAAEVRHPVLGLTIAELVDRLPSASRAPRAVKIFQAED